MSWTVVSPCASAFHSPVKVFVFHSIPKDVTNPNVITYVVNRNVFVGPVVGFYINAAMIPSFVEHSPLRFGSGAVEATLLTS